jgi:DNA polymerase I
LQIKTPDFSQLRHYYQQLDFNVWLAELDSINPPVLEPKKTVNYHTILTQEQWQLWLARLQQADYFAFDTETTSLNALDAEMVGFSFALTPHEAVYVPLMHRYLNAPVQLDQQSILNDLKPLLEDEQRLKIGQHLKYDAHILANYDINLRGIAFDTLLESYVLDSLSRHDLDSLAEFYLNYKTVSFTDIAGKGKKQLNFSEIPIEQAAFYAAEDADIALQLHQCLYAKLTQNENLLNVYETIERPLIPILMHMERTGVKIDAHLLAQHSIELQQRLTELEQQAHTLAGHSFNLNSTQQLQVVLFEEQGLPVLQKTPKGQASTAESVLQELAQSYPIAEVIMAHRSVSKLKSTYTDALPQQIRADTGRIHTSYQQSVTATGRLSSTDPNLQNIPIRTAEGRRIRQAFIAESGFKIMSVDYSQIELRIMAHLSQDETLLNAFLTGVDVHQATAAEVFNVPLQAVSTEQRRSAKAINFGLIYGMSAYGLSKQLGIESSQAQNYIDLYFERYPKVKEYMDNIRQFARDQGFVETVFGRRLYLPDINSRHYQKRQYAERTAINAPMQGTAADIIKRAMIVIYNWLNQDLHDHIKMILQVHDELVFEVAVDYLPIAQQKIPELMTQVVALKIPLEVQMGIADNWDQAH